MANSEPPADTEWKLALVLEDWETALAEYQRRLKEAFKDFDAWLTSGKGMGL
jgi:hypothetical protein